MVVTVFANLSTDLWQRCTIAVSLPNPGGGTTVVSVQARLRQSVSRSNPKQNVMEQARMPGNNREGIYLKGFYEDTPIAGVLSARRCTITLWDGRVADWFPEPQLRSHHPIVTNVQGYPVSGWAYL